MFQDSFTMFRMVGNELSSVDKSFEGKTFLDDLGVDLNITFQKLLSPEGIVNQFALTVVIQSIFIIGWITAGQQNILLLSRMHFIISGIVYAMILSNHTEGPLYDFLKHWEILLSPQVLF